jgi:copper chaperone CopZ
LQDISKWLIIGLVLAAVIAVILPENFFTTYINSPLLNMLIVLAASIPLYVCATGSVPIAAVLMMKGLSPGAALVFLMAGPATNAATMTVIGNSLGRKTLFMYLSSIIGSAIFFGLLIDYLFPSGFFMSSMITEGHTHTQILPESVKYISSILLGLLIIHAFIRKRFPGNAIQINDTMKNITIKVGGMNCNHCKTSVEMNLKLIENIESIQANIQAESVQISGDNIDLKKVEETLNKLGFEYQGVLN